MASLGEGELSMGTDEFPYYSIVFSVFFSIFWGPQIGIINFRHRKAVKCVISIH